MFLEELLKESATKIVIIGVGNAGNNIITELYNLSIQGIQIVAMDTDVEHLEKTKAHRKILIGRDITQGRGSMGDPRIGHLAAEARAQEIAEAVKDADFIIIIAGMGNGTGTGAAPVIAKIARETTKDRTYLEPLIVGITIFPSVTEGIKKIERAKAGINILSHYVDTIVIIKNDNLIQPVYDPPISELFESINRKIAKMLGDIIKSILEPSMVNIAFADIYSIMKNAGTGLVGIGESQGKNASIHAVKEALEMLKSEVKTRNCKGALVHFTVSPDIKLNEINEAMEIIYNELAPVIGWRVHVDDKLNKTVRIFLIAIVPHSAILKEFSKFSKEPPK